MNAMVLAQSWLVIVTGIGGTPQHAASFDRQATALVASARTRLGLREERVIRLGDHTQPPATAGNVARVLDGVAGRAAPGDVVAVVLIGHGSALGGEARFNVRGPDLTARQLAVALRRFPTQEVVVVNTASASGPWVEALAGPRRTIITATRSASERDETTFARFFAEAFSDGGDANKDGRVSLLEAFEYARQGVERHYQSLRRLRTEHPLLDDDGDGRGSLTPGLQGDGRRAAAVFLDAAPEAGGDSVLVALRQRADSLARQLADLQGRRAAMDTTSFAAEMERLLLAIARNGSAMRERQGARP